MEPVSVIVPVYNVKSRLEECLDSILAQNYEKFEVILVDDASTDGSGNICDEYARKDSRIRVIHQSVNHGVSAARNRGLDVATGTYVMFCDSDDCISPTYIESMMSSDADMVVTGVQNLYPDGNRLPHLRYSELLLEKLNLENIAKMITDKSICYVYAKRFQLDIIRKYQIKFDAQLSLGEDTLFVAEYLLHCHNVQFQKDDGYLYYQNTAGSLSGFDEHYVDKLMEANRKIIQVLTRRFMGMESTHEWNARIWSVFYYSIFTIIKSNIPYFSKVKQLKSIFRNQTFRSMLKQRNLWMKQDSKLVRQVIATRCPLMVLGVFRILSLRWKRS